MSESQPLEPFATLAALRDELEGSRIIGDEHTRVRDVRHDSRAVEPGDLFVARRGQKLDGARFVSDALARGAAAIASEKLIEQCPVPQLVVPDAERALSIAASTVWAHPSFYLEVVGVTGTNGKTTTTFLLEHAMRALAMKPAMVGTVTHRYGDRVWPALHTTPEGDDLARRMAAMKHGGAEHLVMEVSSHALVLRRVDAVRFRVAVLTNVTQDHLDFHGTMENYRDAKRSLFRAHGPASTVLNLDDEVGAGLYEEFSDAIGYSARGRAEASLRVSSMHIDARGIDAQLETPEGPVRLRSPLVGVHNVENLLAALGALGALGVAYARGAEALADAPGAPGRLERVQGAGVEGPAVFVDYAHTPDALERVLHALRSVTRGRLLCVFGCGGDRDPSKRPLMGAAVARGCDVALLTTDNPRTEDPADIARMAEEGLRAQGALRGSDAVLCAHGGPGSEGCRYDVELDRRAAIARAIALAGPLDTVLIAGKGHEPYQEIHGVRHAFDDRVEARNALAARG